MMSIPGSGAIPCRVNIATVRRWIERLTLTAGVALLLVYLSAWIHAAAMYRAGLWSFAALKASTSIAKDGESQSPALGIDSVCGQGNESVLTRKRWAQSWALRLRCFNSQAAA